MVLYCSNHSYINYGEISSFAHDSATMSLKCHARQALDEDFRRLIFTCDLIEFHLRLITRSEFPYSMNTSVDVLSARVHSAALDEEDASIIVLCYESGRRLLVSSMMCLR